MLRFTTSWRESSLAETRVAAERVSQSLGISRVSDITRLDRIGIPVFASVRPSAIQGSLCVNAGKGALPEEARVGALMEAIEFAAAENNCGDIAVLKWTPSKIACQDALLSSFVDFCPIWGQEIDPDGPIDAVFATDLVTGESLALPAELTFSPFPALCGQALFGTSTNGLCSGNTTREAALHGLCEVMERDVLAFNCVSDRSRWVEQDELPPGVTSLVRSIEEAGFELALRYTTNAFRLPFFQAYILAEVGEPISIAVGSGLHASAEVAAVRAISEAAQSRLSYIHGARDDLTERAQYFASRDPTVERRATDQLRARALSKLATVRYSEIPDSICTTITDGLTLLCARLAEHGMRQVLYVDLSPPECNLSVLKVIVPGLESFNPRVPRIGRRLLAEIEGHHV